MSFEWPDTKEPNNEPLEVAKLAEVKAPKERPVRVISENSEEYHKFREMRGWMMARKSPVFGKRELEELGDSRIRNEELIARIDRGDLWGFRDKGEHSAEINNQSSEEQKEIFKGRKRAIGEALANPLYFQNTLPFFEEALEDPELKNYFESSFQDQRFSSEWEAALILLKGEIPDTFINQQWQIFSYRALSPIENEYDKKLHELSVEIRAAREGNDNVRLEELRENYGKLRDECTRVLEEEQRNVRADFDDIWKGMKESYIQKYGEYEIPDDIFEKMLRVHVEKFEKTEKDFEEESRGYLEKFRAKIKENIESGELPLTHELVDQRIAEVAINLWDPMKKPDKTIGDFEPYNAQITVRADLSQEEREHIFVHELYHAISGRMITSELRGDRRKFIFRKIGLRFVKTTSVRMEDIITDVKDEEVILTWLNEAYTELETLKHLGKIKSDVYIHFRDLLEEMRKKGVDMDLLRDAYYENDDPNMPVEKRKSAWKAFSKNLQEVYPGKEGGEKLSDMARGVQMLMAVNNESNEFNQIDLLRKKI